MDQRPETLRLAPDSLCRRHEGSHGAQQHQLADWNYGHDDFPDEDGTTTWVAWKGACKNYPITRVYGTLWVNPHPEKEIAKIVITNAGLPEDERRFIAHLAVTLALQGRAKPPARRPRRQEVAGPLTRGTDATAGQQTGRGSGDT